VPTLIGKIRGDEVAKLTPHNACRDAQPHRKVHRAVQVAEQEFDLHLSQLAYINVLKACSLDTSEEAANFALKIVEGLKVRDPRSPALMAATAMHCSRTLSAR